MTLRACPGTADKSKARSARATRRPTCSPSTTGPPPPSAPTRPAAPITPASGCIGTALCLPFPDPFTPQVLGRPLRRHVTSTQAQHQTKPDDKDPPAMTTGPPPPSASTRSTTATARPPPPRAPSPTAQAFGGGERSGVSIDSLFASTHPFGSPAPSVVFLGPGGSTRPRHPAHRHVDSARHSSLGPMDGQTASAPSGLQCSAQSILCHLCTVPVTEINILNATCLASPRPLPNQDRLGVLAWEPSGCTLNYQVVPK